MLQNEDLIAKLAELDDDDHPIGSLDDASAAIDFLKPIAYSACIVCKRGTVQDIVLQSHRTMNYLDQEEKLNEIRGEAQEIKTRKQLSELTLKVLVLLSQIKDQGLVERIVRALNQGKYLEEKIMLNEDDSAAVRHVIKGTVETGKIFLKRPSISDSEFTFEATYEFKGQRRERVDELKLMECSDKAALIGSNSDNAVADERRAIQNRAARFKEVVRLVVGLKAQLSLLHQVGHPHLLHLLGHNGSIRLPLDTESHGFSREETVTKMREFYSWAVKANRRWRECIRKNRDLSLALSLVPASKIVPLIKHITAQRFTQAFNLMSSPPSHYDTEGFCEQVARGLEQTCKSVSENRDPIDSDLEGMMTALREILDRMKVSVPIKRGDALELTLENYRAGKSQNDVTTKSTMELKSGQRFEPSFPSGKALLIQEEKSHDLTQTDQVQSTITLFSVLFPLNLAPHPDLTLHCDIHTSADDILRFFHIMRHSLQLSKGRKTPTGVVVHADKLGLYVQQTLYNELSKEQHSVKQASDRKGAQDMKIVIILTRTAPSEVTGMFEELSIKRCIPILKRSVVTRVLKNATKTSAVYQESTFTVCSPLSGQGKTHWIQTHPKWTSAAVTASFVWGGAQTRSQAAAALARALQGSPGCLHLEMFPFEDTDVDADLMIMELLLWRRVYDPQGGTWYRVPKSTVLFIEVANTLMVKDHSLLQQDAPLIWDQGDHINLTGDESFEFPALNQAAKDFAIAGSTLLIKELNACPERVVCPAGASENTTDSSDNNNEGGCLFALEPKEESGVVATQMSEMLTGRKDQVVEKAKQVLEKVASESVQEQGCHYSCTPTKAMISSFFRQLSSWAAKWASHLIHFKMQIEECFPERSITEFCQAMLDVLKQMVEMAAAVSLRSSAGQAQTKTFESKRSSASSSTDGDTDGHDSNDDLDALANRVVDIRTKHERAWTFNHGNALGVVGDRSHVPEKILKQWKDFNRTPGMEDFCIPPVSLQDAPQKDLQELLLQSMSAPGRDDAQVKNSLNDYVLHRDNMIKMVDIAERLRCSLPVLLMGEAGCGKTFLVRLAAKFMGVEIKEESVHAGTTVSDIAQAIDDAEAKVHELEESRKLRECPFVLLFFDELNTCSHLPIFKRLLIDRLHPLSQKSVHPRLRFVGACNPWRMAGKEEALAGFAPPTKVDRFAGLAYRVYPLPESLFSCLSSFGQLSPETEEAYVEKMASKDVQVYDGNNEKLDIKKCDAKITTLGAQCVARIHAILRDELNTSVSLRDAVRFFKIWGFIRWEHREREAPNPGDPRRPGTSDNFTSKDIRSLVLALHLAYEVRISDLERRSQFQNALLGKDGPGVWRFLLSYLPSYLADLGTKFARDCWNKTVMAEQNYWLDAICIPGNIARVRALRENVYAFIICAMTKTPLIMVGKPGCSKSLSVTRVLSALSGSSSPGLRHLARVYPLSYQGSRQSTSSSIIQVFDRSKKQQTKLQDQKVNTLALVLLDEVGLAEQSPHNPLKVLHSRLEPRESSEAVPVVAISNWDLDRSKMNRALTLACPAVGKSDLIDMASGIIRYYWPKNNRLEEELRGLIERLSEEYIRFTEHQDPKDFHGLRDWYGMSHYAARLLLAADSKQYNFDRAPLGEASETLISNGMTGQAETLLRMMMKDQGPYSARPLPTEWALHLAILVNFGGNSYGRETATAPTQRLIRTLYQNEEIPRLDTRLVEVNEVDYQMTALLNDIQGRHVMVITDAPGPITAWIESQAARTGAGWAPECFVGSCLENDITSSEMYAQTLLQSVIVSMAHERRLMILHNLDIIYPALYDVFNSNYTRSSSGSQMYCRIARAGFCNPRCAVGKQFKVVVVVTPSRAKDFEPALLNRFAKLTINAESLVSEEERTRVSHIWSSAIRAVGHNDGRARCPRPTDIIPACPGGLLNMISLSARAQAAAQNSDSPAQHREALEEIMGPLFAPELVLEEFWRNLPCSDSIEYAPAPFGAGRAMPTFERMFRTVRDECFIASNKLHTIAPLLVPTFKPGLGASEEQCVKRVNCELEELDAVATPIRMSLETSEISLKQKMIKHIKKVMEKAATNGRDSKQTSSILHVHIDMGLEKGQDLVDFIRVQIDWAISELVRQLHTACEEREISDDPSAKGCHMFALVVHGRRGSEKPTERMRPFLLAGPCDKKSSDRISQQQWKGVTVDSFSSRLSWGVDSSTVLCGTRSQILGLQAEGRDGRSESFRNFLRDSLASIVPKFRPRVEPFSTNENMRNAIQEHPGLVAILEAAVAEKIDSEAEDDIRVSADSTEDIELLRRVGSYQLAVLSRVRCDEHVHPVLEAMWFHAIQYSCPLEREGPSWQLWKTLSESLIEEHTEKRLRVLSTPPSCSLCFEMKMPGSPVILQRLLPLANTIYEESKGSIAELAEELTSKMEKTIKQCLQPQTWQALFEFESSLPPSDLSPFCADTLIEVASLAGTKANLDDKEQVKHIVYAVLQQIYKRHIDPELQLCESYGSIDQRWLLPVAGASLLLPAAVNVARIVAAIEPRMKSLHSAIQHEDGDDTKELEGGEEGDTICEGELAWTSCILLGEKRILLHYARRLFKYIKWLRDMSSTDEPEKQKVFVVCIQSALQSLACLVQSHISDLNESDMGSLIDPELKALMFTNQMVSCSAMTTDLDFATIARVVQVMNPHRPSGERSDTNFELLRSLSELIQRQDIPLSLSLGGVRFLDVESPQDAMGAIDLLRATLARAYHEGGNQGIKRIEGPLRCIMSSIFETALSDEGEEEKSDLVARTINYGRLIEAGEVKSCFSDPDLARELGALLREIVSMGFCDEKCAWDSLPVAYTVDAFVSVSRAKDVMEHLWYGQSDHSAPAEACKALRDLDNLVRRLVDCFQALDLRSEDGPLQFLIALGIAREVVCQSCDYVDELLHYDEDARSDDTEYGHNDDQEGHGDDENVGGDDDGAARLELQDCRKSLLESFITLLDTMLPLQEEQRAASRHIPLTSTLKMSAEAFLPPFAALFILANGRENEFSSAAPGVTSVRLLREAVTKVKPDSKLYRALLWFKEDRIFNALGITLLGPAEREGSFTRHQVLESIANPTPDQTGAPIAFQSSSMRMRVLAEVCFLQRSSPQKIARDQASEIIQRLERIGLSRRERNIVRVQPRPRNGDSFWWNGDALPCELRECGPQEYDPSKKLWHTSTLVHFHALLSAADEVGLGAVPLGLLPFAQLVCQPSDGISRLLQQSYWPGLPDNEWHGWKYSAIYRDRNQGNVGVAECECGYRYLLDQCLGPTITRPCQNPDRRCPHTNGGTDHCFAAHQNLVAIPVENDFVWPEITRPMIPASAGGNTDPAEEVRPGLFGLMETENAKQLSRYNYTLASEDNVATTVRDLDRVAFRVLHWLVHASALLAAGAKTTCSSELQKHIHRVARMRAVKNEDSVKWYLKACVDADLLAIAKLLEGSIDDAARFIHAVLHRLVNADLSHSEVASKTALSLEWRSAYEKWFEDSIVRPLLEQRSSSPQQLIAITTPEAEDDDEDTQMNDGRQCIDPLSYMERKCISEKEWLDGVSASVRTQHLPHVLRLVPEPKTESAYTQLGLHRIDDLKILRLCMNGPSTGETQEDGPIHWPAHPDLECASLLGFILPFMQYVRRKGRDSLTMDDARKTSIRVWLNDRLHPELKNEAKGLYQSFETAWNRAFGGNGAVRNGCGRIELPAMKDEWPIAIACPMPNPPPLRGSEVIYLDDGAAQVPEKIAALGLHELAVKHNKMLYVAAKYCESEKASHIKHPLHKEALEGLKEDGSCQARDGDKGSHLLVHSAGQSDLLLYPTRYSGNSPSSTGATGQSSDIPVDYHVNDLLSSRCVIHSDPSCPASTRFDLHDVENQLVFWLFASRRPLKVTSADHTSLDDDISPFPYLRNHGNINISTLEALNARRGDGFPVQQPLHKVWGENNTKDLEYRLYMEPDFAKDILRLAGDLIPILQSVDPMFLGQSCKTLVDLVNRYTIVGEALCTDKDRESNSFDLHPDSLRRVEQHTDVSRVPLEGLISLYLTALEQNALKSGTPSLSGYSEEEVDRFLEDRRKSGVPKETGIGLAAAGENNKVLNTVTRLVVRCLSLSEPPMPRLEGEGGEQGYPLKVQAERMDILDEIDENNELSQYLPESLKHWSDWTQGQTLGVFWGYREKWLEVFDEEIRDFGETQTNLGMTGHGSAPSSSNLDFNRDGSHSSRSSANTQGRARRPPPVQRPKAKKKNKGRL